VTTLGDTEPYHCLLDGSYHILTDCPLGRRIPPELIIQGKGDGLLCPACRDRVEARRRRTASPDDPGAPMEG
jgi:hypothetical protein